MNMSIKKRITLGSGALATVGAVATLVAGVTFGFFSASQGSSTSNFATGTVSIGSPANTVCSITNMVPGDNSVGYTPDNPNRTNAKLAHCVFSVTYTGSVPAYIGLSTSLNTGAGTLASALQWEISDGVASYTSGGTINTNSASNPLYVATDAGGSNTVHTFTVDYALPDSVTSQTLTAAALSMTVYAVQQGNNGTGVCVAGSQCANVTSWS
jgi:Camelysin metallo-endopeptidase